MELNEKDVSLIVAEVIKRLNDSDEKINITPSYSAGPVFNNLDECISASEISQKILWDLGLEKRKKIIQAIRDVSVKNAERLARMIVDETKMGRWEDKVQKNLLAAEKTPGVEDLQPTAFTGDRGLTLVENAPYGIIAAVTPSTNPASTIINNAISIIAAGNSVIFAPHPAAKNCSLETIKILNDAIISTGGPSALISTVNPPSIEFTQSLLKHPKVKLNLVTGGPAIVKVAMSVGKKTIAAGPGNPPCIVDETAIVEKAAVDMVSSASFDNGILCTAEKETLVVADVFERFLSAMRKDNRVYELSSKQMDELAKIVIKEPGGKCKEGVMNRDYVGRNASVIAKAIGLDISDGIRLLWGVVDKEHPFVWTEQLMPVMPVVKMKDVAEAIEFGIEIEGGNHHTFIMHSLNVANLTKMARKCQGSIFVKNGPSYMGLGMGEGYAALSIATPTGDGLVKARNFTRPLRCVLVDYFRIA
ncbi:MAG TPA: aldehyde dehydrogenase EutE [Elusimicrobia bacterium]|nr:aldehyde dehydrogenase EutE [Elusimicrobiota bacterium]